ncbi:hypothetical protein Hanom_Chr08g00727601 [Helianthus anomalus]
MMVFYLICVKDGRNTFCVRWVFLIYVKDGGITYFDEGEKKIWVEIKDMGVVIGSDSSKHFFRQIDDDGTARMVDGRFLNLQPHFAALIIVNFEPNPVLVVLQLQKFDCYCCWVFL